MLAWAVQRALFRRLLRVEGGDQGADDGANIVAADRQADLDRLDVEEGDRAHAVALGPLDGELDPLKAFSALSRCRSWASRLRASAELPAAT